MGLHTEQLTGRTQQRFFDVTEEENFLYPEAFDVDFNKRAAIDAIDMDAKDVNLRIQELMAEGYGSIVVKHPQARHSLGVGILQRLNLIFEGSLGYFGVGLIDGPNVRVTGPCRLVMRREPDGRYRYRREERRIDIRCGHARW